MKTNALIIFVASLFIISCGQTTKEKKTETTEAENVTYEEVVLDTLLAKAENYVDKNVSFTGTVTHVCKHGGQKMFLFDASEEESMKVTVGENYAEFKMELEGSTLKVEGIVREQRIDETYLTEWEAEVNAAMTEPEEEHAEEEHHDDAHHATEKSHEKSAGDLEKIQKLREKIEASEKGYLSNFSVECVHYQVLDDMNGEMAEEETAEE